MLFRFSSVRMHTDVSFNVLYIKQHQKKWKYCVLFLCGFVLLFGRRKNGKKLLFLQLDFIARMNEQQNVIEWAERARAHKWKSFKLKRVTREWYTHVKKDKVQNKMKWNENAKKGKQKTRLKWIELNFLNDESNSIGVEVARTFFSFFFLFCWNAGDKMITS